MKPLPQINEQVEMESRPYEEAIYDYKTWQVVPEYIPNELADKFSEQFRMFDRRDSGVIKIEDVSSILGNMERQVSPDQIKTILENLIGEQAMPYSTNYVDFKEYLSVLSVLTMECISEEEMYDVFCMIDLDGDGYISSNELGELLSRMGDKIADDKVTEMIKEADLDGDGKVSYPEFVCLLTNSDGKMNASARKGSHPTIENFVEDDNNDDKEYLMDVCRIFIEEASDTDSDTSCESHNIPTKPPLKRMRSLSVGNRPTARLELPQNHHRRKKSISELLHLTSTSKKSEQQKEYRRVSVAGCPSVGNPDFHHSDHKRRFSTSGLHLKHLFKKHQHG